VASRYAQLLHAVRLHWNRAMGAAGAVLSTTDGRWALVSTMATVVVAGSIAWLAAGMAPHYANERTHAERNRSLMPYDLFARLASQSAASPHASYAAFGPSASIVTDDTPSNDSDFSMDGALAAEQAEDNDTPSDTRTVTLESGDTLVGALTEAGVTAEDANAAVAAMAKVYSPRSVRAGQSFDLSFEPPPPPTRCRKTQNPPPNPPPPEN